MVKVPMQKMRPRMILFFFGKRTLNRSGMGMLMMIKSLDMLNTAFVMRWFVAAEHCSAIISAIQPSVCNTLT